MLDKTYEQLCLRVNGILPFNLKTETFAEERLYPERGSEKKFRVSCGVIAFVTEERNYYVSPFANLLKPYLIRQGYKECYIEVPFIDGEAPSDKHSLKTWVDLCDFANKLYREQNVETRNCR